MTTEVVYFDYWTRGIRHFAALDVYLKEAGLSTLLVHLGSQRGESIQVDQVIEGISCKDIVHFNNDLILMLKKLRPRVVLLLNNQSEDRILVRACRALNIYTVFLMHGILTPIENMEETAKLVNSAFGWVDRFNRIPKYLSLLKLYLRAAALDGITGVFDKEIALYFIRQAISPGGNLSGKWKYRDVCADTALVYSQEDKKLFVTRYGYLSENVEVVGNYNLDVLFGILRESEKTLSSRKRNLVYIENGFSDPKYTVSGWTEDLVADEVQKIAEISKPLGYTLVVKLHPSSDYSVLIARLNGIDNIKIIHHCNLSELIANADGVFGQSSSVLMMVLAAKKPLAILSIPPLDLKITTFSQKGFGILVRDYAQMASFIKNMNLHQQEIEEKQKQEIEYFVGPFDGQATARIAQCLISRCK